MSIVVEKYTFDDVVLQPRMSATIESRNDIDLSAMLTTHIKIKTPLVSSPMDTVTEDKMAIIMARMGGVGILHRYSSPEEQASWLQKVKRSQQFVVLDPFCVTQDMTVNDVCHKSKTTGIKSFLVTDNKKLVGIITERDIRFANKTDTVTSVMTTALKKIILETNDINDIYLANKDKLREIFHQLRVKKIPIVNSKDEILGLISSKDMVATLEWPNMSLSRDDTLLCGAAIGIQDDDALRLELLVKNNVDFICVDTANGDQPRVYDLIKKIRVTYPNLEIITGNIATYAAHLRCYQAGANAVRVGIGCGSACTTRLVSGCGYPQLSAIMDTSAVYSSWEDNKDNRNPCPLISDGGSRHLSGNMVKALMAGASTVMLGSTLAGTDESPGQILVKNNKPVKIFRGMAGYGSNISRDKFKAEKFTPEGVESTVEYRGSAKEILHKIIGGIKSGISYCGGTDIVSARSNAIFFSMTSNGQKESGVHDINEI